MSYNSVWFILIAVLWVGYFILEGFDFGVGILLKVVAKNQIYILEGVSAGQSQFRPYLDALIWLDISDEIGLARVLDRDGDLIKDQMITFQQAQKTHFAKDLTKDAADYIFDGVPKTAL